jgi:uncharacterized DUF497 family protein
MFHWNATDGFSWKATVIDAQVIWDLEDDPEGNVQHIAEHGVTVEEVEEVLFDPKTRTGRSRSSGRPEAFGETSTGKYITVIWEEVCDDPRMIYPITAHEVPRPLAGRDEQNARHARALGRTASRQRRFANGRGPNALAPTS